MAEFDELLANVRQGSARVCAMISQQESLQQTLLALPVQVA